MDTAAQEQIAAIRAAAKRRAKDLKTKQARKERTSAAQIQVIKDAAKRKERVRRMKEQGKSLQEIADAEGVSRGMAQKLVRNALAEVA